MSRAWLLGCCAALLTVGCGSRRPASSVLPAGTQLQVGDVVFRRGGGMTSHVVVAADRNGMYSHVGIVVDSAGTLMIVHAVPGEPDFDGDQDRVKMDRPQRFFSTELTDIGEIRRCDDSLTARRAADEAMRLYRKGVLFDHDYDDTDTTRMYCTELIVACYRRAGTELIGPQRHHLNMAFAQYDCIFPSDLQQSSCLRLIETF